jgi:hypothetical protein
MEHNKLAIGKLSSNISDASGNKCSMAAPRNTPPPKDVANDSHFGGMVGSCGVVFFAAAQFSFDEQQMFESLSSGGVLSSLVRDK